MKVCLLTRGLRSSGGIGRVTTEIKDGLLRAGHEVSVVSSGKEGLVGYFWYVFFGIKGKIPEGYDVYHAITPMESIWIPKDKGIVTVLDVIAITHTKEYGGRLGSNWLFRWVGKKIFEFGVKQALGCRYVVCISEDVKQEVIDYFGVDRSRVKVIRLGIPI